MNAAQDVNSVQDTGRRARNRLERHDAFVRTAKAVVATEGLDALTMQRIARELDCAVGTAYTYFPSKSALVAELQREAIEVLTAAFVVDRNRALATATRSSSTGKVAGLAQVVAFCRFWVSAESRFPEEFRLLQLLLVETGRSVIEDDDVSRVLPAGVRLLAEAETAMARAAATGALQPGDARQRSLLLVFAINGVLAVDRLSRVDADLFDGRRLAAVVLDDLLTAWGADRRTLLATHRLLEKL